MIITVRVNSLVVVKASPRVVAAAIMVRVKISQVGAKANINSSLVGIRAKIKVKIVATMEKVSNRAVMAKKRPKVMVRVSRKAVLRLKLENSPVILLVTLRKK